MDIIIAIFFALTLVFLVYVFVMGMDSNKKRIRSYFFAQKYHFASKKGPVDFLSFYRKHAYSDIPSASGVFVWVLAILLLLACLFAIYVKMTEY